MVDKNGLQSNIFDLIAVNLVLTAKLQDLFRRMENAVRLCFHCATAAK